MSGSHCVDILGSSNSNTEQTSTTVLVNHVSALLYALVDNTLVAAANVSGNTSDVVSLCSPCFFPHHCLANNTCLTGTTGPDCEVCQRADTGDGQGYQMVGSSCVTCSQVPVAAVALAVFLIMVAICLALSRLSSAAVTKIKLLVNFVQLVFLALFVKVEWPAFLTQLAAVLSFSTFTTDVSMIECLLPDVRLSSYMRWLTAVAIPSLIFCVGICIDRGFKKQIRTTKREYVRVRFEKKRSELRYFLYLIIVSYYMSVALSAVQSYSCTATFGQTFNFILTLFVLVYIVLVPLLLIFFTLRQRKWALLECKSAKFGFIYDSYIHRFCFWDSLAMVRKVTSIGVTSTVLTDPLLQSVILLCVSGSYLLLLVAARPYRRCCWKTLSLNIHMMLEVVCTLSLCVIHTGSLLLALHLYPDQLDFLLLSTFILTIVLWLGCALAGRLETQHQEVTFEGSVEVKQSVMATKPQMRIKRNQVGEYVTSGEVDRRAAQVEF